MPGLLKGEGCNNDGVVEVKGRFATFHPEPGARALIGDFTDWKRRPIALDGPVTLELLPAAYVEYAFLDEAGRPFADPRAPRAAENPWWPYARAFTTPGWRFEAPPLAAVEKARIQRRRIFSEAFFAERRVIVYEPPAPPKAAIVVQDGVAFFRIGRMAEVAEAQIQSGEIHPVRLIFLEPEDRDREYRMDPRYRDFVVREVVPELVEGLVWGSFGASLGGLMALWLWQEGEAAFAMAHSPALKALPGGQDAYTEPEWLAERLKARPGRVYLEVGRLEWLLAPARRLAARLAGLGVAHGYAERPSGHNWVTWRQGIAPGLRYLVGKDLAL